MKLSTLLAGVALAAGLGTTASAMELRFGHVGEPGSLFDESANAFAACANAALGDKAEVVVFGSSQLGNDKELLQKLKLGQVHFSLPSSIMSSVSDTFGVFEMPYIIKDRDHMSRVWSEMEPTFQKAANENGYRIIGLMENGFRHITNNVRPINTPDDLAGIKLRTPSGAWRVKMFQTYGANPTPLAFSEVFTALQTGVMDGQENPYAQIASAKFQEVQKYLSVTGHVYTPGYVLTSDKHFGNLPEDVQAALTQCGSEVTATVYEIASRMETDLLQVIKDAGVEVNEADKDAFIAASKPIYDEFAATVEGGPELVQQIQALASGS
jgi:tripartite ATP-independent transporter DctP family solute receptor